MRYIQRLRFKKLKRDIIKKKIRATGAFKFRAFCDKRYDTIVIVKKEINTHKKKQTPVYNPLQKNVLLKL